jgi:hypothetical protein
MLEPHVVEGWERSGAKVLDDRADGPVTADACVLRRRIQGRARRELKVSPEAQGSRLTTGTRARRSVE